MKAKLRSGYIIILIAGLISCNANVDKQPTLLKAESNRQDSPAQTKPADSEHNDSLAQLELADSIQLVHIKNQFYKSKSGQLFERTIADREMDGVDTLVSVEYFNGMLPHDLDPLTFEELDGWFARDKNLAYYYRPTSGGMLIEKLEKADAKTFKIIPGDYKYALDKNYVFDEATILKGLYPATLKIERSKDGQVKRLISGKIIYDRD